MLDFRIDASKRMVTTCSVAFVSILVLFLNACTDVVPLNVVPDADAATETTDSNSAAAESQVDANAEAKSETTDGAKAKIAGEYEGMPVGVTAEGRIFRGSPDAPITIYEYSDYQCPFCQRHFSQTEPALNESFVETGQVRVVFMDFPLVQIHPNAPAASAAALCISEQDPVAYWEMHALIFETQNEWANLDDPLAYFEELGSQLDVDDEMFASCLQSGRADARVESSYAAGESLGFSGTPSFQFVNETTGETFNLVGAQPFEKFRSWIEAIAAGDTPADATPPERETAPGNQEIPYWATEEGLAPDPERPGYTMAGDEYRGSLDAPVVIVEYSDYQCPFCRRHTTDTQPILDEKFVDSGQVRWVFKHFPLNIHPQAPMAGVAAECAAEQGFFWEMHELLFAYVSNWSVREPNSVFVEMANELDLNIETFETCLEDDAMMERIESDFADGRPFVQGTPTFIVLSGGQGRIIPGALPAATFSEALQEIIDSTP